MNNILKLLIVCFSLLTLLSSCGPSVKPTPSPPKPPEALSPEEQNELATVELERILDMITEHGKSNVLLQVEESYWNIINKYPDAFLAEESYWRLIVMNLVDYDKPLMDKADRIRDEFIQKYPDSKMIVVVDDSVSRFYYRRHQWKRLLNVCTVHIRRFLKTNELETPLFMFFYAEAKYNLKDFVEAKKGYKIVINRFPGTREAQISSQRLDEIGNSVIK